MTKLKNSLGFSVLHLLLVVVIIGMVCGTGWFVWKANRSATRDYKVDSTSTSPAPKETAKDNSEQTIPEGYTTYTNADYGFSFAYPKEWGDVQLYTEKPGRVTIGFQAADGQVAHYGVALHKASIEHIDTDTPIINATDFTVSSTGLTIKYGTDSYKTEIPTGYILSNSTNGVVYKQDANDPGTYSVSALKHIRIGDYKLMRISGWATDSDSDITKQADYFKNILGTFRSAE